MKKVINAGMFLLWFISVCAVDSEGLIFKVMLLVTTVYIIAFLYANEYLR
ncbi:hypothetical protein [Anaerostipes hominis (ex Lee et al. 2021)]|nr:hypothetical protein [Anaerostipes hominis (ex Lee et al. 2021)]